MSNWKQVAAQWVKRPFLQRLMILAVHLIVPKQRIGVGLVVFDEQDRVLLLKHVFHPKTPWGLPGGWLGRDESPEQCALRELMEETGLTAVFPRRARRPFGCFLLRSTVALAISSPSSQMIRRVGADF